MTIDRPERMPRGALDRRLEPFDMEREQRFGDVTKRAGDGVPATAPAPWRSGNRSNRHW
jgi:hypothetical protein